LALAIENLRLISSVSKPLCPSAGLRAAIWIWNSATSGCGASSYDTTTVEK
jgi:hypothetical protein